MNICDSKGNIIGTCTAYSDEQVLSLPVDSPLSFRRPNSGDGYAKSVLTREMVHLQRTRWKGRASTWEAWQIDDEDIPKMRRIRHVVVNG